MIHSENINELSKALAAAQKEFVAIPKDGKNPFFKSAYASLPKVVETSAPILSKQGLAISQFIGHDETGDILTTWLLHDSGQYIADSMTLHLVKNDPQSQGSATTYARRYSYMSVLGLVADEDDDGNATRRPVQKAEVAEQVERGTISDAQMRKIAVLLKETKYDNTDTFQAETGIRIKSLSLQKAKELIDKLNDASMAKAVEDAKQAEEPF